MLWCDFFNLLTSSRIMGNVEVANKANLFYFLVENFPPEITGPSLVNVTIGQTVVIEVTAVDDQDDAVVFNIAVKPNGSTVGYPDNNTVTVTWIPTSYDEVGEITRRTLAKHVWDHDHMFDFDNFDILGHTRQWSQRLFLEAWHSPLEPNSFNEHIHIPNIYSACYP